VFAYYLLNVWTSKHPKKVCYTVIVNKLPERGNALQGIKSIKKATGKASGFSVSSWNKPRIARAYSKITDSIQPV
jgi:hypothetical protein